MIVGVDRFPELVYKVGEGMREEPETLFLGMKVGNGLQPNNY